MLRNRRVVIAGFVVVTVLIFSGAFDWALDMAFHPWARATPPLLGEWTGSLTTGSGERLLVSLELRRALTRRGVPCAKCAQIEGQAATCDARGAVLRYRVSGSPTDRNGRALHLGATPERDRGSDGLELNLLRGTWDGGNALGLEAAFVNRGGATAAAPLSMRRGKATEFETMCGRLAPV